MGERTGVLEELGIGPEVWIWAQKVVREPWLDGTTDKPGVGYGMLLTNVKGWSRELGGGLSGGSTSCASMRT